MKTPINELHIIELGFKRIEQWKVDNVIYFSNLFYNENGDTIFLTKAELCVNILAIFKYKNSDQEFAFDNIQDLKSHIMMELNPEKYSIGWYINNLKRDILTIEEGLNNDKIMSELFNDHNGYSDEQIKGYSLLRETTQYVLDKLTNIKE